MSSSDPPDTSPLNDSCSAKRKESASMNQVRLVFMFSPIVVECVIIMKGAARFVGNYDGG